MKYFLFSNNLIQYQLGFRPGHSTLDMLLLLTQQWMEALNVRHEIRAVSLDISHAFDTVRRPTLFFELSACGIQGQRHTWLTDFLDSHCQRVALNGILSSPSTVKTELFRGSVLGPVLFLTFINDLSDSLENPLYLFGDDSVIPSVIPQTGKPQLLHSLQIWIKSQTDLTHGTCLLILTNPTLSRCLSERIV